MSKRPERFGILLTVFIVTSSLIWITFLDNHVEQRNCFYFKLYPDSPTGHWTTEKWKDRYAWISLDDCEKEHVLPFYESYHE